MKHTNLIHKTPGESTISFFSNLIDKLNDCDKFFFTFLNKNYFLHHVVEDDNGYDYSIGLYFKGVDNDNDICCAEIFSSEMRKFDDKDYIDFNKFEIIYDRWLCF